MKFIRTASVLAFGCSLAVSARSDVTVPAQTVGNNQTLQVTNPGNVTTTEHPTAVQVQVQLGGKAVFIGGTSVVLKPGFRADSSSLFRASRDLNLGNLASLVDSDFDNLADAWELLHYGNLTSITGLMDSDGDGISNTDEYYAGSSPAVNEASAALPGGTLVVIKTPTGKFQKILVDWSITAAP